MYNWVAAKGGNGFEASIENIYNIKKLKCYELYENIFQASEGSNGLDLFSWVTPLNLHGFINISQQNAFYQYQNHLH